MTAALGRLLILGSLLAGILGTIISFHAARSRSEAAAAWSRRFAYGYALLIALANVVMVYALLVHDFSVSYVAQVGSRSVPVWVTVVSLWSSLEGSILFWGLILGIYVALAQRDVARRNPEFLPQATAIWLACGTFFSLLLYGPAQPFASVASPPFDGPGPNPLLQNHVLMAIHPPFLYLGYVGMTIPFGLASAALLQGRLGASSARAIRKWLLVPWTFLTLAIVLGGWWAYEVLGWGGYWAWDPVENASLLPWLTATAAIHSAVLMERKGMLKGWTVTLVMSTFLLTILGTFMTRSGIFNSVHSFTQSAIGPTILIFLVLALIWTVVLLSLRIDKLSSYRATFGMGSREGMFLLNNLLFVLFTFTVLLGTVFPLVVEAATGRQMSVGQPYFDKMAVPIGVALVLLMGVGPALPWGRTSGEEMRRKLLRPVIGSGVLSGIGLLLEVRSAWTLITLALGGYAAWVTLQALASARTLRRFAAYVIHAAVLVVAISISVSSTMKTSREIQLRQGESAQLGEFTLTFTGVKLQRESHRDALVAPIEVRREGRYVGTLNPRMNFYATQREPIGTPAIRSGPRGDLYLSVASIDEQSNSVALHAIVNPMVPWIWIATGVIAVAALTLLFGDRKLARIPRPRWIVPKWASLLLIAVAASVFAQTAPDPSTIVGVPTQMPLEGIELDRMTTQVASLVRCPVCQGLSVNDSPASMAVNMKGQVRDLLSRGYSREQILKYFEASYGEFALLEPPRRGINWIVWILPAALLVAGGLLVYRMTARPPAAGSGERYDPTLAEYLVRVRREAALRKKGMSREN